MFSNTIQLQHLLFNRRQFVSLMDLYERNYNLTCRLIPDLNLIPTKCKTSSKNYPDLYLTIQARCKFTTMMNLTYRFPLDREVASDESCISDPDLNIRVYHDARMVEAMSCQSKGFMSMAVNQIADRSQLECRWESNLFLNKWLEYVIGRGYQFKPSTINCELINGEKLSSF